MNFTTVSEIRIASRRHARIRRGYTRVLLGLSVCLVLGGVAGAQTAQDSSLYLRAQQMVANGDAARGRSLADSVAAAAPAGSAAYAEGLYWRAMLATNARDSEHAYRQIIVDYPLSGRVPDALLRIGQLEASRGENAAALQHFQRLVLEHPQSPLHAEASYWVAQMYFAGNDASRACTASADALTSAPASNVELKNRIDFQQQRCRGVALARDVAPAAAPAPKSVNETSAAAAPESASKVASTIASTGTTTGATAASRPPTREEVARVLAASKKPATAKAAKTTASKAAAASAKTPAASDDAKSRRGAWAVQIAAFGTKQPATLLVAKLRGRGYDVYVDGTSAPYRVRIGHYPTYAAATAALVKLKAKQIDGFVAER
jgi:cell division septation protein DedD